MLCSAHYCIAMGLCLPFPTCPLEKLWLCGSIYARHLFLGLVRCWCCCCCCSPMPSVCTIRLYGIRMTKCFSIIPPHNATKQNKQKQSKVTTIALTKGNSLSQPEQKPCAPGHHTHQHLKIIGGNVFTVDAIFFFFFFMRRRTKRQNAYPKPFFPFVDPYLDLFFLPMDAKWIVGFFHSSLSLLPPTFFFFFHGRPSLPPSCINSRLHHKYPTCDHIL